MEKSLFFDSINGDRKYNSSDFTDYFKKVLTNGVFPNPSANLQVLSNGNLTLTVKSGGANINGYLYALSEDKILTVSTPNATTDRNDLVVVRWNITKRTIEIVIKANTTTLERTSTIYELALAQILVKKGTASISQAEITDTRQNTEKCGLVNSLIQADTTTLFNQFENGFNTWFDTVKGQLDGDVATNLINKILEVDNKVEKANENIEKNKRIIGDIEQFSYIPTNEWLNCDGRVLNINDYQELYNVIGENYTLPTLYDFTERNVSSGTSNIVSICRANGYIACITGNGEFFTSVDKGVSWVKKSNKPASSVAGMIYGADKLVCWLNNSIYYSSNAGNTWSTITIFPSSESIQDLIYNNGVYIACGGGNGNGYRIYTSTDLVSWTQRKSENSSAKVMTKLLALGDKIFASSCDSSPILNVSNNNGITWGNAFSNTKVTSAYLPNQYTTFKDKFVLMREGALVKSSDGVNWEEYTFDLGISNVVTSEIASKYNDDCMLFYFRLSTSPNTGYIFKTYDLMNFEQVVPSPTVNSTSYYLNSFVYSKEIGMFLIGGGYGIPKLYTADYSKVLDTTFKIPNIDKYSYIKAK